MLLIFTDCFSTTYASARSKFVETAQAAGARLSQYAHPSAAGEFGEALSINVARLGNRSADRQLPVISGTHGQEGYAGAAAQVGWLLSSEASPVLKDVGVLLVHGLNPYGFSHGSRTTENNVDLNRNFVDHTRPYPENPGYETLHHALTPAVWSRESFDSVSRAEADLIEKEGADALFNALVAGQYSHPDGLLFGGNGREWSNVMLERILAEHFGHASKVAFIEWHTGIGDYGKPFFLSFNEPHSAELRQAALWWGGRIRCASSRDGTAGLSWTRLLRRTGVSSRSASCWSCHRVRHTGPGSGCGRDASGPLAALSRECRQCRDAEPDARRSARLFESRILSVAAAGNRARRGAYRCRLERTRAVVNL